MQKQQPTTGVAKFNRLGAMVAVPNAPRILGHTNIIQYPTTTTEVDAGPGKHEGETSQDVLNHSKPTLQHPCWCLKFGNQYLKPEPWAFDVTGMLQTFLRPLQGLGEGVHFSYCLVWNLQKIQPWIL